MTQKVTFKPTGPEYVNDSVWHKHWDIKVGNVVIGEMSSTIRDLFQSRINPGYSVTLTAKIYGVEKEYREYSAAFSNRSMRESRENRSIYIRRAQEWARNRFARDLGGVIPESVIAASVAAACDDEAYDNEPAPAAVVPFEAAVRELVLEGVRTSRWYNTAPPEAQSGLQIDSMALEQLHRYAIYDGDSDELQAVVAGVSCGGESRRFAFSLGSPKDLG